MAWRQLSVVVREEQADDVSEGMTDLGALSASLLDEGDHPLFEPKPGETPVWPETRVVGLFEVDADLDVVELGLKARFGGDALHGWRREVLEDQVWERAWLEHFRPMRFGRRLWVCPTGFEAPDADAVTVILDPGLAFGTGTHATTALCLEWLDGHELAGRTVIDYGCGSGILAVAALLLGAERALALDIDPQALLATEENARKNAVAERLTLVGPGQAIPEPADILLANILANPLGELAESLSGLVKPTGHLALSGILPEQADGVSDAYRLWFPRLVKTERDGWIRLHGMKITQEPR
jgi:ribosomal protein L11 methyltransferase